MATQDERMDKAMESLQIDFTNAGATEENFGRVMTGLYLHASADCYVAFDTSADGDDFRVYAADGFLHLEKVQFTRLSVLGVSGSGTLYVIATSGC